MQNISNILFWVAFIVILLWQKHSKNCQTVKTYKNVTRIKYKNVFTSVHNSKPKITQSKQQQTRSGRLYDVRPRAGSDPYTLRFVHIALTELDLN